jgi:hypothetical protein
VGRTLLLVRGGWIMSECAEYNFQDECTDHTIDHILTPVSFFGSSWCFYAILSRQHIQR